LQDKRVHRRQGALIADLIVVLGFVAIGRANHGEGDALTGTLSVAAPFLIGLGLGWLRVWRAPNPTTPAMGLRVLAPTIVIGLLLRSLVFNRAIPLAFDIVATVFLTATLIGWRAMWSKFSREPRT
jgi:hypothetical protein